MSTPSSADRNLIFGLLALQMDFVTPAQLLDAMNAWMLRKSIPVQEILRERGMLNDRRSEMLAGLVEEHIALHGGDPRASLAALRVEPSVRCGLDRLDDAQLQDSLASLPATPVNGDTPQPFTGPATTAPLIGAPAPARFRRLREHASGGLGEVFVALDAELNREVALKEIQDRFADRLDVRSRFLREAEITGNLEHPGVVPVYGLGAYPDGRPYYAMRFIRGESMQDAIARFHEADRDAGRDAGERSLTLRDLLGRFVAVCHAVAYAHSRGVIHRDLKPANVMLGEYGETLVVDWGLARSLDRPGGEQTTAERPMSAGSGGGTAPTEMGQVVGTPAFMPPEQAEGRLDLMGVASDVFSLGATLYAIVTGRPPYHGDDILGQARRAEVVPARQLARSAPAALEAVCARAMAKRPQDRYPAARVLAEEVQRFLADEPVQAYPEPLADRLRRWGRRNRSLVWAGVVLLAASVVGLSVGLWAVGREQARTREAARVAEEQKERAQQAEEETLAQFRASTDDAIEQLIGAKPVLGPQEKTYLQKTLKRWQAFAGRTGDDERSRAIRAEGHFRVAVLQHALGQADDAAAGFREALVLRRKLADEHPDKLEYRKDLAGTHNDLANLLAQHNQSKQAVEQYQQALDIERKLAGESPGTAAYRRDLAVTHNNLGLRLAGLNQWARAAEHYGEALNLLKKLADEFPDEGDYRHHLANTHNNFGALFKAQHQGSRAVEQFREALVIRRQLAKEFPDVREYRRLLAGSLNNLALMLGSLNQGKQALELHDESLAILEKLVGDFPGLPAYRKDLAVAHLNLGESLAALKQWEKSAEQYRKALTIQQKLVAQFPDVPAYRKDLAGSHHNLATLLEAQNQPKEAAEQFNEALAVRQKLADDFPNVPEYRSDLAGTHNNLGFKFNNRRQWEKSAEHYKLALAIQQKLVADFPNVPRYQVELGGTYGNYGRLLQRSGKPADSLPWFDKAIRTLGEAHQQSTGPGNPWTFLRNGHVGRAAALVQLKKYTESVDDWTRAIELSPPPEQPPLRLRRADSLVRANRAAEAVAEVAELTKSARWSADEWYDLACICAVACAKTSDKKQEYADRAMKLLQRAVEAGYPDAAHLAGDEDLEALSGRADFKKLVEALAKMKQKKSARQ